MIFQILSYFRFLLSSTNQHGVHSPFVFNLVTKCFYDKSKYDGYIKLKEYRDILYKNSNTINVVDFGSGSRIFKTNTRKISSLAKHAGTSKKRTQLLYRLVTHLNVTSILELGTSLGIGSSAMAINHPNTSILTIEGCPETAKFTQEMFNKFELTNITLKNEEFNSTLHKLKTKEKYDLIYIDGNHNKKATLEYFELIKKYSDNDTCIIFDDIYWSRDMKEAWEIIKKDEKTKISIDSFFWGFIFFRRENIHQEHFKIRL